MNTITIKDPNGNIVCSVENVNPIRSSEDFPAVPIIDFDIYKLLLLLSQIGENLEKDIPIKFEKENLQITNVVYLPKHIIERDKKEIVKKPLLYLDDDIITFVLNYIDKNKPIPNHNMCIKTLNDQIANKIRQFLSKNNINVDFVIDKDKYNKHRIDLNKDEEHLASLHIIVKDNPIITTNNYDEMFDKYCNQTFKSLVGKKIKKSTITSIEPNDHFSSGIIVKFDTLDDFDNDYSLVYKLENTLNKCIANCPLNKFYNIQFKEQGYYEDDDGNFSGVFFDCVIDSKINK